ncbi:Conserved oligomeric Golgi complex subunit 2 [Microtus ochrogaster]|uniref:Conserved oligomeric Golgi complex subunit 2 n=1 Tax=Microtus ochrogaster TaxID=79684 RepID=A0A8J6GZ44_MICOH|nr:Conserved oligomeric Golgi complex subunit 2 [Microtus ochrogaster]
MPLEVGNEESSRDGKSKQGDCLLRDEAAACGVAVTLQYRAWLPEAVAPGCARLPSGSLCAAARAARLLVAVRLRWRKRGQRRAGAGLPRPQWCRLRPQCHRSLGAEAGVMERSRMNLPTGPDTLCFDKDEFMKEDFDVDHFVSDCRKRVQLEELRDDLELYYKLLKTAMVELINKDYADFVNLSTNLEDFDVDHFVSDCRKRVQLEELRDDLELYYKLLKTAMVELINKDYADFVNLSTNLVGMDRSLNQLSVPLGQLREEVLSLRSSVSEGILAVEERMSKQEDIRKKKMSVLRLIQVIRSVEKIEKILNTQSSKDAPSLEASSPLLTGQVLERIATEFNQLQFHAVQSKGMPLLDKVRPRIAGITAMLQQSLEGLLLEGLQTSNVDIIRHCLRTYATIDKTRDAEALVGQVLVKPYVDEVIVEQFVKSHPHGLQLMYNKLLEFVPHHCRLLREVTGGAVSSEKGTIVPGYDFLVNSVWPEIVRGLEEKLPSLFNPGNPDAFHEKYTVSMDFVQRFERQCGSQASVKRLRAHPAYHSFSNKWNLPVYFQLRFREVAGSLEASFTDGLEDAPDGSPYCLLASHRTWSSLEKCWSDEMFLPLLAHRLWRLTLQILARFSVFVTALEDSQSSLSAHVPALSSRIVQDLSESCFSYLKSALEVPRLYRRTNKEVPGTASSYVESALKPFYQLQHGHGHKVKPAMMKHWVQEALSESTHRYFETVSDVLNSVKKMEESLKRLKQARRTPATNPVSSSGGMSDDDKIRLQLALDVEFLGEQIQKMGLQTNDIKSFPALVELVLAARDQATTEQP